MDRYSHGKKKKGSTLAIKWFIILFCNVNKAIFFLIKI